MNASQGGQQRPGTATMNRTLHDRETFMKIKMEKSAPYFRQTRVQTCSHIIKKNGKSIAV